MGFLFRLLACLPLPVLHKLGALAGWLAWALSPAYRRHLRENLAQAGMTAVRHAAIAEAGKTVLELPYVWLRPHAEVLSRVVGVEGLDVVDEGRRKRSGILFLTPHLGCFEIAAQFCSTLGPMTALYRRPGMGWLAPLIERGRGTYFRLAPADLGGVRKLLKALKGGEAVFVLPDQAPSAGEGVWAPFFERPAYTMTLAARLSQTGATVVLVYAERLAGGAGYRLCFATPQAGVATPADCNYEIEQLVRRCPEQYLWGYNRYKKPAGASEPR